MPQHFCRERKVTILVLVDAVESFRGVVQATKYLHGYTRPRRERIQLDSGLVWNSNSCMRKEMYDANDSFTDRNGKEFREGAILLVYGLRIDSA